MPQVEYETVQFKYNSGWMHVTRKRVDGTLMDMYSSITNDYGSLVRIDSRTTPPFVFRPGDGS